MTLARLVPAAASRVAVVAGPDVDLAAYDAPGRVVHRHRPDDDLDVLHDALVGHGHLDAVVDLGRGPGATDRLPMLLMHLRHGGLLVVALPHREQPRARLLGLLDDVQRLRDGGALDAPARRRDSRRATVRDRHALAASVAEVVVHDDAVAVTMAVDTWLVVPEVRLDAVLAAAPGLGRVVAHEPAATWTATASFVSSDPDEVPFDVVEAPALSLREHHDAVVAPRSVAHVGGVVLPQAFRDTVRRRPRTPTLTDWSPWAVRVPADLDATSSAPEPLPGTWFHGDNILRGHFGHALTEQLSLLWAWPAALARHPDLGLLVTAPDEQVAGWELELLEAAGVPRERVRVVRGPVRVERLLAATPAYVIGEHLHPVLHDLHRRAGDRLAARSTITGAPARLFVTRRGDKRACHERREVEALVEAHGFTVVAPEEHPLPDQVAMVRAADVVAGFGGSGLFHLALTDHPTRVLVVSSTTYHVWNERAMAAFGGHPLTVVRGTPDATPRRAGFDVEAFHSDYTVDCGADGPLARALAALDAR